MAVVKPYYDKDRMPLRDVIPLPGPLSIVFEPTRMCNFKCYYCAHSTRGVPGGVLESAGVPIRHMDMDLYDKLVHDFMEFPEMQRKIGFGGLGEPLMNPNLGEMIRKLRTAGYKNRLNVITNGVLFIPERAAELVDSGISCIQISVQGLSSKSYKEICGVEIDFDEYINNIRNLFKISRGKTEIYIKIIDALLKDENDKIRFYELFGDICDTMHVEHLIDNLRIAQNLEYVNSVDTSLNMHGEKIIPRRVCQMMFYNLQIYVDGSVFSCCNGGLSQDFSIGNIKSQSLKEMWNGEKRLKFMIRNLVHGYKTISKCAGCGTMSCVITPEEDIDDHVEEILARLENMKHG